MEQFTYSSKNKDHHTPIYAGNRWAGGQREAKGWETNTKTNTWVDALVPDILFKEFWMYYLRLADQLLKIIVQDLLFDVG